MAAPIPLRSDFTASDLRSQAKQTRDAKQTRRLLALAAIYDGGFRSDAARIGGVGLQFGDAIAAGDYELAATQLGRGVPWVKA